MKMTPIGLFPQEWNVVALKNVTNVVTGATPSTEVKEYWGGHIPWMSSGELNMKFVHSVVGRITQEGYDNCGTHMIPEHCVLIGLAGQGKTRGTAAYNTIPLCTNQSIGSILPSSSFNPLYLYYWIDSQYNFLRLLSAGDGGRGGLNKQLLLNLLVPFPALSEQNKIADALFSTDSLIISLDKAIAKKRQIKEGLMQQLLTGEAVIPEYSGEWQKKRVGDIGFTYSGLTGKTKNDFGHGEAQYITFLNVLNNPVLKTDVFEKVDVRSDERQNAAKKGDLFFNTSSETPEEVGICALLNADINNLYLNSFCFGFRLTDPDVDGLYLSYFWRSKQGREIMSALAQGATRYNLSKEYFNKAIITLPPIELQRYIANTITAADKEIAELEQKRDKYLLIKQGMMQELLTGKTRLV